MSLPFFYTEQLDKPGTTIVLAEETSRHMTQVLRMKMGDPLLLTNGKGVKATAEIRDDHRKHCEVQVMETTQVPPLAHTVTVAISLLKNATRFEWFSEKATEIGVSTVIPLLCARTEKEKFRYDRLKTITISAMLQSQQCWLPRLQEPADIHTIIAKTNNTARYIAHCLPGEKTPLLTHPAADSIILIGPEGDFTPAEIAAALANGFQPVTLGPTRLRTETAGIVAATLLCIANQ